MSSLIYLRARYYDPSTGQFISRDPLTATTRAPYSYTADNPLNLTDPSGLTFDGGQDNMPRESGTDCLWGSIAAAKIGGGSFLPDYVTIQVNTPIKQGPWGGGASVTLTKNGTVFAGPTVGRGVGRKLGLWFGAGYISNCGGAAINGDDADRFVNKETSSVGGAYDAGAFLVQDPNQGNQRGGSALEFGVGTPQAGVSGSYSAPVFRTGFRW